MPTQPTHNLPTSLEDFAKVSRLCSLCSRMCRHSCPTHMITRSDACSPIGRALIIELHRGGKSAFTDAAVDRLYQCNLCGACKAWCKPRHELPRIIELARERIVDEHRAPTGTLDLDTTVSTHFNVFGEPHNKRFEKIKLEQKTSATKNVLYFVGCTTAYRHPEIAQATIHVLEKLDISVELIEGIGDEVCCGSPLIRAGFTQTAKMLAQNNRSSIIQSDMKTVITTCPGCTRALRLDYPQLGVSLPPKVKVLHITEFLLPFQKQLAPLLKSQYKASEKSAPLSFIYHDPCHLGRELAIYKQPRQLLKLVPSGRLVEFHHNREYADCCGGGGALPKTFPLLSGEITQQRLRDANDLGASYLISACPNCKLHFSETQSKDPHSNLLIIDIMELLAKFLKTQRGVE